MQSSPPPGFERPAHVPPPHLPARKPAPANWSERWREPLLVGFTTFLIGNALGFIAAGLVAPADLAVSAEMPGRASMMDLWTRYGVPAVGVLAAVATFLRARRASKADATPLAVAVASGLPFLLAVALIFALYPGSRAARLQIDSSSAQTINAREYGASVSALTLEQVIAQYKDTPYLDEALVFIKRSDLITGPHPLPAGAVRELRWLLANGKLDDCPTCASAIEAKDLWNQVAPNLVGWALDRCPDATCRDVFVAQMLPVRREMSGGCYPLPKQKALSYTDFHSLRTLQEAGASRRSRDTGERLETWLALQQKNCRAGIL